jgi:hypothetical protein
MPRPQRYLLLGQNDRRRKSPTVRFECSLINYPEVQPDELNRAGFAGGCLV